MGEITDSELLPPDAVGYGELERPKAIAAQVARIITRRTGTPHISRFRGFDEKGKPRFDFKPGVKPVTPEYLKPHPEIGDNNSKRTFNAKTNSTNPSKPR